MRPGIFEAPDVVPGLLGGEGLEGVHIVAGGVEPVLRVPRGVLAGEEAAHRQLRRQGAVVLAGDQPQVRALVGELRHDRGRGLGRRPGDLHEDGEVGEEARVDVVCSRALQVRVQGT